MKFTPTSLGFTATEPGELAKQLPQYIRRPPVRGRCPISDLNLSAVDKLVRPQKANNFSPPVRSKRLLSKGAKRPVILIEVASLLAYLASLPDATIAENEASK